MQPDQETNAGQTGSEPELLGFRPNEPAKNPAAGSARKAVRIARYLHVISACWVLLLGVIILVDVFGRVLFDSPLLGATEIIKNSVVSITFLQLPLAIFSGSMLRTTILAETVPPVVRKVLRTIAGLLGATLFIILVISAWDHMIDAWEIGEYEGEGALRVPTYPVRTLMVATSVFCALAYLWMIWLDWNDQLDDGISFPDAHSFQNEPRASMENR